MRLGESMLREEYFREFHIIISSSAIDMDATHPKFQLNIVASQLNKLSTIIKESHSHGIYVPGILMGPTCTYVLDN
jgi:hypothetical protein